MDSNDRDRLPKVKEEIRKAYDDEDLQNAPILIFFNKQDIEGAMSIEELLKALNIEELQKEKVKEICYEGCSAKTGDGVWKGMSSLGDILFNDSKTSG